MAKKKNKAKKIDAGQIIKVSIILLIVAAIIITCGIGTSWFTNGNMSTWFNSWGKGSTVEAEKDSDDEKDTSINQGSEMESFIFYPETNNNQIALFITPLAISAENKAAVSKEITAIVTSTIKAKQIDWTIESENKETSDKDLSEIITVKPTEDGAKTAIVSCYSAFEGTMIIKATLRGIGVYGTCKVVFVGVPSSLKIAETNLSDLGNDSLHEFIIPSTGSFFINFELDNIYHSVGEKYVINSNSDITFGKVRICDYIYTATGLQKGAPYETSFIEWATGALTPKTFNNYSSSTLLASTFKNNRYLFDFYHAPQFHCMDIELAKEAKPQNTLTGVLIEVLEYPSLNYTIYEPITGLKTNMKITFNEDLFARVTLSDEEIEF